MEAVVTSVTESPLWNIVSLALPALAALIGAALLQGAHRPGDFAGAIGGGVLFVLGMGVVCLLGEVAAIAAIVRQERLIGLSLLGIVVNLAVILPALYVLTRNS